MSQRQAGVVLLAVLGFILVMTMAAGSMVSMYSTVLKREKEAELLFVGEQYRKAIQTYYNTVPPGGARSLPSSIESLLNDSRFATPVQHLRKAYPDPMTGRVDWVLIREAGGVVGVRSASNGEPLRRKFPSGAHVFISDEHSYSGWNFRIALL